MQHVHQQFSKLEYLHLKIPKTNVNLYSTSSISHKVLRRLVVDAPNGWGDFAESSQDWVKTLGVMSWGQEGGPTQIVFRVPSFRASQFEQEWKLVYSFDSEQSRRPTHCFKRTVLSPMASNPVFLFPNFTPFHALQPLVVSVDDVLNGGRDYYAASSDVEKQSYSKEPYQATNLILSGDKFTKFLEMLHYSRPPKSFAIGTLFISDPSATDFQLYDFISEIQRNVQHLVLDNVNLDCLQECFVEVESLVLDRVTAIPATRVTLVPTDRLAINCSWDEIQLRTFYDTLTTSPIKALHMGSNDCPITLGSIPAGISSLEPGPPSTRCVSSSSIV
ncbi:hypothetical protein T439DRAFT_65796 [Meredithblackwellia eburnea MCA 4105]